jgi:hypothetical protein
MTYGNNVSELRTTMIALLKRHRILQPLGGPGIYTAPETTTVEERLEMGEQIQRHRYVVLSWCAAAVDTVAPNFMVGVVDGKYNQPVTALMNRLEVTASGITAGYPAMDELATPHPNKLVETWRQAAKACVLSEIDLGPSTTRLGLDAGRARVVLKDAADFIRGLVVLDARYSNVPGWRHLEAPRRLESAAEVASIFARWTEHDLAVDRAGWRRAPAAIEGPALPGIGGVVQAQHNTLVDLCSSPPTGMNLRRIIHSQIQVAHEAGRHAAHAAPELVEPFLARERTYKQLHIAGRSLGGLIGNGGQAAAESANAAERFRRAPMSTTDDAASLHELARLFTGTDARMAATIEHGCEEKLYFVSTSSPRLADVMDGIRPPAKHWVPATSSVQFDLVPIVRDRLRPPRATTPVRAESVVNRRDYDVTLADRPGVRRSHSRTFSGSDDVVVTEVGR